MKAFLLVFLFVVRCRGYSITQQAQLHANLSNGYDRNLRPGENRTLPTKISIDFYIAKIKELKEEENKMSTVGYIGLEWTDHRLTWNPADYNDELKQTSMFISKIWAPNVVLFNPVDKRSPILTDDLSCTIKSNGQVKCFLADLFEATCSADISGYPFDAQYCTLKLFVPGFSILDIILQSASSAIHLELYEIHGLWYITDTSNYVKTYHVYEISFEVLELKISLKRRNMYCVCNIILPIFFINLLQAFVFFLPLGSGERVNFSMTVLLAVVVFLTIIQSKLPEFSKPHISSLTIKLLLDILVSIFIVLIDIMISYTYHKTDNQNISKDLKKIVAKMMLKKDPIETIVTWKDVASFYDKCGTYVVLILLITNFLIYWILISEDLIDKFTNLSIENN